VPGRALAALALLAGLAGTTTLPTAAHAQVAPTHAPLAQVRPEPSLSDRETARALMDEGDARRDAKDYRAALKAYEAADGIMHVPTTGLEVARTQALLGLLLEARESVGRVLRLPVKAGEPAPFVAARKSAEALNTELAGRIPSIQASVANADPSQPVQISIDGEVLPAASASIPRKLNPGKHTVVARAGAVEKSEDVMLAEKETRTVTLDLSRPKVAAAPHDAVGSDAPSSPSVLPKVLMYGGFGLGAVGIIVGSVTGTMSIIKMGDAKSSGCSGDSCIESRRPLVEDAEDVGNISTASFIVGGVGVAIGLVGYFLQRGQVQTGSAKQPPASASASTSTPASAARSASSRTGPGAGSIRVNADVGLGWLGLRGQF